MRMKIIILGGVGTALNIAEAIWDADVNYGKNIEFLGFSFDDEKYGNVINGFPVLCKTSELYKKYGHYNDVKFLFQMNNPLKMPERLKLVQSYQIPYYKWYNFIHPTAYVARSVKMGIGNVIFVNCVVNSNVEIGNHCTFLACTTIGHDTKIRNHVFSATHVSIGSSIHLENNIFIGQNAAIKNNIFVAQNTFIGLGSSIVHNVIESNKIVVGSPGKSIRTII